MWGYSFCVLGEAWCVVQHILEYKLLQFQLGKFKSSLLYVWLSRKAPLTISYIIKALEGHFETTV